MAIQESPSKEAKKQIFTQEEYRAKQNRYSELTYQLRNAGENGIDLPEEEVKSIKKEMEDLRRELIK